MKTIFIAWEKHHARTDVLAKALGAEAHFVYRLGRVGGLWLLLKYLWQSADTIALLLRERPRAVIVQTPPVFPALIAVAYARLFRGARVIIDAHSGNFHSRKWRWSLPLHRWASRRAALTVVHMRSLLPVVEAWGAAAMDFGYVFEAASPQAEPTFPLPAGLNIAVPSSYNGDEPVGLVFEAAKRLPEVNFLLTGNARRIPPALEAARPPNVRLTGYLPVPGYYGLLAEADAVLALTTQDQTFQTGGAEAVWLGRPLIMSNWPELREVFARGTVFVDHTVESLVAGIGAVERRRAELEAEMRVLKRELDASRRARVSCLQSVIAGEPFPFQAPAHDWVAEEEPGS
jgi:hypothetical protein